jgi:hypothetical protein
MLGSSRTACFIPTGEIDHILPHLALVNQALVFGEDKLDGVFQREDVFAVVLVDVVENRSDRRAFPGAGHASQQDQSLIEMTELLDGRRQKEALEVGNAVVDAPRHHAERTLLPQNVHTEPPHHPIDVNGVGKVASTIPLENLRATLVEHRHDHLFHLLFADRIGLQRLQRALDPHVERLARLEIQIAPLELHGGGEEPIDLQPTTPARRLRGSCVWWGRSRDGRHGRHLGLSTRT